MTAKLVEKVRSGSLTEKGLINLHNNVRDKNLPGVIAAIERQMRGQFPKAADRLFGKKEAFAIQRLQEALAILEGQVHLAANTVKNGVKPGGQKLSGKKYLNVYAAYRNSAGVGCYLSLEQETIDSELFAVVGQYKIGNDSFRSERKYTMDAFNDAAAEYVRLVKDVASGGP
jgi:hypothetical protein